jgi:squalene-associated FAD-dependent desaturase
MWHPLCLAALNTPPERASAKVFLAVLRDSLGARRAASDMLLPRLNLGALFPDAAARHIERHHGQVRTGVRIEALARDGERWLLAGERFDAVVLATPPNQAARLLDGLPDCAALAQQLAAFDYEPITTCYLQYEEDVRLSQPMYALDDTHGWGQFVFDRGQLDQGHAGLLSVVISASRDAADLGQDELTAAVARQLSGVLGMPALAAPRWTRVITEKRATFACVPNLPRPDNATHLPGLALAGDYTASDYPATLESAVRSALRATSAILSRRTLPRQNSSLSQSNGDGDDTCVQ